MARTPTSYDPDFWSSALYRSLKLFSGEQIAQAADVAQLLVEYFRHVPEQPTHFSYQAIGARQRKSKTKSIDKILTTLALVEGRLESMYVEAIRENDHTHAVASTGYDQSTIARNNTTISACGFVEDFDFSLARHLAIAASDLLPIDYGFSSCRKGLLDAIGFGYGLRIDSDPFSAKRTRWLQDFDRNDPRPSAIPFLSVFELNVLSDMHMSKSVAGRPFETYVSDKGRGTLERIGKSNYLWCLDEEAMVKAKADLAGQGLVAMV